MLSDKCNFKINTSIFALCTIFILNMKTTRAYNNITSKYMVYDEEQLMKGRFLGGHGKPRFLSFSTDDDDISIEMQLSVPFLKIPVKASVDSATGLMQKFKPANINLAALGLAGTLVFATSFVLPSILKLFSVDHIMNGGMWNRAGNSQYWMDDLGDRVGKVLETGGVPPTACVARALCWLVRRSADASNKGNPKSSDKIIDGLASNEWLRDMLEGTIFSEAITFGYAKESCTVKYPECKINQNTLQHFMKSLSSKISNM